MCKGNEEAKPQNACTLCLLIEVLSVGQIKYSKLGTKTHTHTLTEQAHTHTHKAGTHTHTEQAHTHACVYIKYVNDRAKRLWAKTRREAERERQRRRDRVGSSRSNPIKQS